MNKNNESNPRRLPFYYWIIESICFILLILYKVLYQPNQRLGFKVSATYAFIRFVIFAIDKPYRSVKIYKYLKKNYPQIGREIISPVKRHFSDIKYIEQKVGNDANIMKLIYKYRQFQIHFFVIFISMILLLLFYALL